MVFRDRDGKEVDFRAYPDAEKKKAAEKFARSHELSGRACHFLEWMGLSNREEVELFGEKRAKTLGNVGKKTLDDIRGVLNVWALPDKVLGYRSGFNDACNAIAAEIERAWPEADDMLDFIRDIRGKQV